ncbi:hypothetical protein [Sphingobium subterraneum]|nr:hypothetical protein [Sphingobium subterraneum]
MRSASSAPGPDMDPDDELILNIEAEQPEKPPFSHVLDFPEDLEPGVRSWWLPAAQIALGLTAAAWIALGVVLLARRNFVLPALEAAPSALANFSIPLIGIAILYLVLMRSSLGEATRFGRVSAAMRREAESLDMRLAIVNQQLDTARQAMQDQARALEHYGASATANLEVAARNMAEHSARAAQQSGSIERSGLALAHQFGQLIDVMPALEDRAARMAVTLADGSHVLSEKVDGLDTRLASLVKLTEDARARTLAATQSLTAQLLQVQDATRSASEEVSGLAELASSRIGVAIDRARQAVEETGLNLDQRMTDLNLLIDQSRNAVGTIGQQSVHGFAETVSDLEARLHALSAIIDRQQQVVAEIDQALIARIDRVDERFHQFEDDGLERNERLGAAIDAMGLHAERLDQALRTGNGTAEQLIARSETLLLALDASVRELDETHPGALTRLDERIANSRALIAAATPEIEQLEAISSAILGRTQEAEELLRGQARSLSGLLDSSEAALAGNVEQVASLQQALESADESARRLTDSAGPQLVAALLRVKDTADQAAERARQALGRAISEAAEKLGEASEQALREAMGDRVNDQLENVAQVAERAVKAAHVASDRLMRQLLTIADTSAAIEKRVAEAEHAAEARDRDSFARRSAVLIESLNSASIDVAKILSGDVSDSSWAAYLKGDRGVFTRRAVRLLDATEARSVAQLYDDNDAFRDHVNRYIHDFEAMLRTILSARDGSALGVTLLSSDMGKLYVALAQAIDRLRG